MNTGDLLFRGALVLCILALAGIFAYELESRSETEEDAAFEDIVRIFRSEMSSAFSLGAGSRITFVFGDGNGTVVLPADISGEAIWLEVLPGIVMLGCGERTEIVMEDRGIIPTVPPLGEVPLNISEARILSRACGGFSLNAPFNLQIQRVDLLERSSLFVYPLPIRQKAEAVDDIRELISLMEDPGKLIPYWSSTVEVPAEHIKAVSGRLIIFDDMHNDNIEGRIGTCVALPRNTDMSQIVDGRCGIAYRKHAHILQDGTMIIRAYAFPSST